VDTGDLLVLDLNQVAPDIYYHRGRDLLEFEQRRDTIVVKGEEPVTVKSTWTIWGPIVNRTDRGKQLVHHWTMHDPAAANLELLELAEAGTVEEGLAIAHRCGIPPQNIVLADHTGAIAWTIAGRLPRRFGYDGRFPVSWTYGDRGWDGYLSPAETPVWRGGDLGGAIWSANQRHVGGELYSRLGDNAYYEGDRAAQIQANLARLGTTEATKAQPADLLAIQLDTRGRWLDRWRHLVLAALDEAAVAGHDARAEFRRLVAEDGDLRAEPGSVNYRLVRQWHDELLDLTLAPIFARCVAADPHFDFRLLRTEEAVWALHEMQPMHLLAAQHASWRELRLAAVDAVIHNLRERNVALSEATWGARNRAKIRHPFSSLLPIGLGSMLDLPDDPLPGDQHLPRVQRPSFGASLRFVVAPGRESEGIMHLPGGQSGHPLSPYYRAGHRAWVEGRPLPLLPGEPVHTLEFQP
ncbi:MAG TPA: penicillin acylase family protein, partial [Candidatus Synoicihabitans sp.]|nr:penicillin acylase family protein [Candidatus Synoicihabitans sp.]